MYFPRYRPSGKSRYLYCSQIGRYLIAEDGEAVKLHSPWQLLRDLQHAPMVVLCHDIESAWWWPALIEHGSLSSGSHGVTALRIPGRRHTSWLVNASTWGVGRNLAALRAIRAAVTTLEVGDAATASALGVNLLRALYPLDAPTLSVPTEAQSRMLREHLIGGRADVLVPPGWHCPTVYEADINSAYPYAAMSVPAGNAYALETRAGAHSASFRYARVAIPSLPLGPLPLRVDGAVTYPTDTTIDGAWWQAELQLAEQVGCTVDYGPGWAWTRQTNALSQWAYRLKDAKQHAVDWRERSIYKRLSVAALGRFLSPRHALQLGVDDGTGEPYVPPHLRWNMVPLAQREEYRATDTTLEHVASWIYAQTRITLYCAAYQEALAGTLVATNFDAVFSTRPPAVAYSEEIGDWKLAALHGYRQLGNRQYVCEEKRRLPGITGKARLSA